MQTRGIQVYGKVRTDKYQFTTNLFHQASETTEVTCKSKYVSNFV